ncbi:TRAP transporter large permease subunit [Kutzneria sp. NPDC052558]|uniref:TRAP transporter large permease subunit n=1 Tax=Kutzneria sp. NPDC052558 TaxID=3364121 RepID=UPI0037CC65C3
MIVGIVLVVLSVAAGVAAVAFNSGGPTREITAFGQHVANADATQIFIGGIVIGLVFCVGVWMVSVAGKRRRALRAEFRAARREAADASRERDRLAEQLSTQQEITQREQETTVIGRHHDREVTS